MLEGAQKPGTQQPRRRIELEPLLEAFMRFHHLARPQMAELLGCPESALALIDGRSLPEERDGAFRVETQELARQMGASEARILQWIRVAKLLVR